MLAMSCKIVTGLTVLGSNLFNPHHDSKRYDPRVSKTVP
jgi:hypothetical protein